jgi:signal transduction histidine kinase
MAAQEHRQEEERDSSSVTLPSWAVPLHPLVNFVARIRASVHTKLLGGFLIGALLLLGMAVLSLVVINRMGQQVEELARLQDNMDRACRMEYLITAQSHFRAMALLTKLDFYNDDIALAKTEFLEHLDQVESTGQLKDAEFFQQVREANNRFAASSARVLDLYQAGRIDEALALHIEQEHEVSHEIEDAIRELQADAIIQMSRARAQVESDRGLIAALVWTFSGVSLVTALFLGFATSWAFIRPVRAIDSALERIARGDFTQRVAVPNRDEFGTLGRNVNRMSEQLASLYHELGDLNEALQQRLKELQEAHGQLQEYATQAEEMAAVQERNRLARELHDSVTQTIFSMTLTAETARILLERDPSQSAPHLTLLQELAQSALSEMRALIQQLRPSPVEEGGLVLALQQNLAALERREGLKVSLQVEGEGQLPRDQEEGLFRIVQEALNNVVKHAQTSIAAVWSNRLQMEDGQVSLLIEDQGAGFGSMTGGPAREGFGLTSMRERVEMLGGALEVKSSPGKGTQVLVQVPQTKRGNSNGQN